MWKKGYTDYVEKLRCFGFPILLKIIAHTNSGAAAAPRFFPFALLCGYSSLGVELLESLIRI
ncbi:MAG: hypothetical protein WD604_01245, partial [Balneolaceae bacterium]